MKCVICERRPARNGAFCVNCATKIVAETRRKANGKPSSFLTYRGHVVGLFPNGGGTVKAQLLQRSADNLPKSKVINLNIWCEGFDRETIKRFKRTVLTLANA